MLLHNITKYGDIDPLTKLSIRHGSDKFGAHQYTPAYHSILKRFRCRPIKLIEIGVGGYASPDCGGSSLAMWAEYFPLAQIFGLDIMPKALALPPTVRVLQGSQVDDEFLSKLINEFGPFDIVIDDGSHLPAHMLHTFRRLYPNLTEDGVYIVEDTQTCFRGHVHDEITIFEFAHLLGLQMHACEGYQQTVEDNDIKTFAKYTESVTVQRNFISVVRGNNRYPSNFNLDFANETIENVYQIVCREASLNPTGRGLLCQIDMCIWAGRYDQANRLAIDAMQTNKFNLSMLSELKRLMEWANMRARCDDLQSQLNVLQRTASESKSQY